MMGVRLQEMHLLYVGIWHFYLLANNDCEVYVGADIVAIKEDIVSKIVAITCDAGWCRDLPVYFIYTFSISFYIYY